MGSEPVILPFEQNPLIGILALFLLSFSDIEKEVHNGKAPEDSIPECYVSYHKPWDRKDAAQPRLSVASPCRNEKKVGRKALTPRGCPDILSRSTEGQAVTAYCPKV